MGVKEKIVSERELIDYLHTKKQIVLYGAGMVGGLVKNRLQSNRLADRILCFVKTEAAFFETRLGIPVMGLDFLKDFNADICILVCAMLSAQKEMILELETRGIKEYITVSDELFLDLQEQYMSEQRRLRQEVEMDRFDVIFFSQDNNSTSGAFISMVGLCDEIQKKSELRVLVVLPRYGDGEKLLNDCMLKYIYVNRSAEWIRALNAETSGFDESYALYNAKEIERLRCLIRNTGARLVHISGMFVFAGAIAAAEEQVPVIWHIRENISTQGNCFIRKKDSYKLLNRSRAVICVSNHVRQAYPDLDEKIVRIIYNGADDGKFYEERDIFSASECRIVMVGYITPLKGQEILIRAVEYLKNRDILFPSVTFVGGGDSGYLEYLRKMIFSAGLENDITFVGKTMEPEIYYRQADIAVSATSGGEGFDRVRIEAMLSGCLMIANDVGAAREIVKDGETGYLYENGNAKSLAEAIKKAAKDIERSREMAGKGQRLCREKFTKRYNAEQVLALYREVLGVDDGRESDISAGF